MPTNYTKEQDIIDSYSGQGRYDSIIDALRYALAAQEAPPAVSQGAYANATEAVRGAKFPGRGYGHGKVNKMNRSYALPPGYENMADVYSGEEFARKYGDHLRYGSITAPGSPMSTLGAILFGDRGN